VILALHPGTRVAIEAAGSAVPASIHVIEPTGYRTTLALELHAAAILTDSGGVQREAAWLGVPCLVLRPRTEWIEAVEGSAGQSVVVGLDAARASTELARLADPGTAASAARARAANLHVDPSGAAAAISAALSSRRR
jgi:UDP-GlcNAc3NAcA epimerase